MIWKIKFDFLKNNALRIGAFGCFWDCVSNYFRSTLGRNPYLKKTSQEIMEFNSFLENGGNVLLATQALDEVKKVLLLLNNGKSSIDR